MADNKDDMSLDDILTSIRSVVMDEKEESKTQEDKESKETQENPTEQENIDNIENAIFNSENVAPSDEATAPEPVNTAPVEPKQPGEESLIKQAQQDSISETIPTNDGSPQGLDLSEEERNMPTEPEPVDTSPSQLSDIMELGNTNATPPMVSGKSAFDVESSIKEIIEILNQNKAQLPPEFFEKQDEVIKTWLNGHLPDLVEKIVQEEISRIFKYVYKNK